MLHKIYKVRFVDQMGHEVAEFGFYESRSDAIRRASEIGAQIKMQGHLDICEVEVIPSSDIKNTTMEDLNYYTLKTD